MKKKIMKKLTKEKIQAKLQRQKIRYERQLKFVKQIDNEQVHLIESNFNDAIAIILQEQWLNNRKQEILNLYRSFQRKKNGLKKTGCQQVNQNTSVRDPDKQENNIEYQIYYQKKP